MVFHENKKGSANQASVKEFVPDVPFLDERVKRLDLQY